MSTNFNFFVYIYGKGLFCVECDWVILHCAYEVFAEITKPTVTHNIERIIIIEMQ